MAASISISLTRENEELSSYATITLSETEMTAKMNLAKTTLGLSDDKAVATWVLQRVMDELNAFPSV